MSKNTSNQIKKRFFVYFMIESPFTNRVKIGKTASFSIKIKPRLRALQTGNPNRLIVHKLIECPDQKFMDGLEKLIHHFLNDRNALGEWFVLNSEEIDTTHKFFNEIANNSSYYSSSKIEYTIPFAKNWIRDNSPAEGEMFFDYCKKSPLTGIQLLVEGLSQNGYYIKRDIAGKPLTIHATNYAALQ